MESNASRGTCWTRQQSQVANGNVKRRTVRWQGWEFEVVVPSSGPDWLGRQGRRERAVLRGEAERRRMLRSFDDMLRAFGLERVEEATHISVRPSADGESAGTLQPAGRDHERITRMLAALAAHDLHADADALRAYLRGMA